MEWFDGENIFAVFSTLLGLLTSVGVLWYERRVPRRKRIGYRVQMDTAIGSDVRSGHTNVRLGLFDDDPEMADATLVLLRLENDGSQTIAVDDYTSPDIHGLTVTFTGRTIKGVAVTLPSAARHLMSHFTHARGLRSSGSMLTVPKVPLNKGQHFKLLVLLTGGEVGEEVTVSGGISEGEVVVNRAIAPDEAPPVFSRATRLITVLLTVCVVTLASIILLRDSTRPPIGCAKGELTVIGSTAFRPVAEELEKKYEDDCPGSGITVDLNGSAAGIRELAEAGARRKEGSPAIVALSDGPKSTGYAQLRENRVAVSTFALVVNDGVEVDGLSTSDVREIYRGDITNWQEVGGPDLAIRLVSRNAGSGTRDTFQRRVLQGFEPGASSTDCQRKDDARARVLRCEFESTEQVLNTVAELPGALGYSELRSAAPTKGLHRLELDGRAPSVDDIAESGYPYREIEYAYTYGRPPASSLGSSFLNYLIRGSGQDVIRTHGHLPCATPEGLKVCAEE
ncbi:substrate-binding domain-containing protein [Streptomyces sp. NBC_00838]|uniref:PstS family phosphate ABC transporter substrate-binding protein n=1 Tax=Streptomyces sp. NBC_00838 TaxID=2903680 RepID=UPI00386E9BC8|nr:substrate-binding domain-containing protein [Streptomyces sp. NBC_00838]